MSRAGAARERCVIALVAVPASVPRDLLRLAAVDADRPRRSPRRPSATSLGSERVRARRCGSPRGRPRSARRPPSWSGWRRRGCSRAGRSPGAGCWRPSSPCRSCCRRSSSARRSSRCCRTACAGTTAAIVLAHVYFNVAVVVRVVGALWAQLPADLAGAARTLGAGPLRRRSATVTLPLLRPALIAAGSGDVPVHVHVVRRGPGARRTGEPDGRGGDRPAGDAARRRRRRGGARRACSSSCSALLVAWSVIAQRRADDGVRAAAGAAERARPGGQRIAVAVTAIACAAATLAPLAVLAARSVRPRRTGGASRRGGRSARPSCGPGS